MAMPGMAYSVWILGPGASNSLCFADLTCLIGSSIYEEGLFVRFMASGLNK